MQVIRKHADYAPPPRIARLARDPGVQTTLGRAMLHAIGPIRAGYDVVRILAALVLLVAAGLKA